MIGFKHTHTIVAVQRDGAIHRICVMADGPVLYTEQEWTSSEPASWELDPERGLLHLGRVPDWCRSTELKPVMPPQRGVLFSWKGFWAPEGPDNGRGCVFSSEAAALAWARAEYDLPPSHFHFLPIPTWPDPPP
jgi:hypothetical protein